MLNRTQFAALFFILLLESSVCQVNVPVTPRPFYAPQENVAAIVGPQAVKVYMSENIGGNTDSLIRDVISAVNVDTVQNFIRRMQNFGTRNAFAPNRDAVAAWLKSEFLRMGYSVVIDSFFRNSQYHKNIIATLPGRVYPAKICISGGHFDSASPDQLNAPGADDNASGTAAVLECARVFKLKNLAPAMTIQFMAFGAEEYGLWGSNNIAQNYAAQGKTIGLMINHDMISNSTETIPGARVDINYYTGSENWRNAAITTTNRYTMLSAQTGSPNSSGSDSYSFWTKGYPCVYFEETQFSPWYHSFADTLGNYNMPFCAQVIKASCALLILAANSPTTAKNVAVYNTGTGNSLKTAWAKEALPDLKHYKISVGTKTGVYSNYYYTTDTSFVIGGLQSGVKYFAGVSVVNTEDFESPVVEKSGTPTLIPSSPANLVLEPRTRSIFLQWSKNPELDIRGYNIYRSPDTVAGFTALMSLSYRDTSYTDNTAPPRNYLYYKVTAVDSTGNESEGTVLRGRVISLDQGICLINESKPGDGTISNPTAAQLQEFYRNVFSSFSYDMLDANLFSKVTLSDIGPYSTIVWLGDDMADMTVPNTSRSELAKYVTAGGKLFIVSYSLTRAFGGSTAFPAVFQPGSFVYDNLKISGSNYNPTARFIGALPLLQGYPPLSVDSTKSRSLYNYHLSGIEALTATQQGIPIYKYDSRYDTSTSQGRFKGSTVAVQYLGADAKLVAAGFPLYFLKTDEARAFVNFVLSEKLSEPTVTDEENTAVLPGAFELFQNFPNPFNPVTVIKFALGNGGSTRGRSGKSPLVTLRVYDLLGRERATLVNDARADGTYEVRFDASGLPSGTYFYELRAEDFRAVKKLILLK